MGSTAGVPLHVLDFVPAPTALEIRTLGPGTLALLALVLGTGGSVLLRRAARLRGGQRLDA